jgi:hypothetical protein
MGEIPEGILTSAHKLSVITTVEEWNQWILLSHKVRPSSLVISGHAWGLLRFSESGGALHFEDKTGPLVNGPKGYAIVDFPDCSVPENKSLVPGMPSTCIPVPIAMFRCEKNAVPWRLSLFGFARRSLATKVRE